LPADQRNGGSVWTTGSYDPALNLVYWGTGGPIPHSEIVRGSGDGAVLYARCGYRQDRLVSPVSPTR